MREAGGGNSVSARRFVLSWPGIPETLEQTWDQFLRENSDDVTACEKLDVLEVGQSVELINTDDPQRAQDAPACMILRIA